MNLIAKSLLAHAAIVLLGTEQTMHEDDRTD